jgi:hypothetical protein
MTRPRPKSPAVASEPPPDDEAHGRRRARLAAAVISALRDMPPEVMFRPTRGAAEEAEARQVFYLVQLRMVGDGGSAAAIADLALAVGRDRATVQHAVEKIERACEASPALDMIVDKIADLADQMAKLQGPVLAALPPGEDEQIEPEESQPAPRPVRPLPKKALKHAREVEEIVERGKRARAKA